MLKFNKTLWSYPTFVLRTTVGRLVSYITLSVVATLQRSYDVTGQRDFPLVSLKSRGITPLRDELH